MAEPIAISAGSSSGYNNASFSNHTTLQERLSVTTGPTRCEASSSAAPHAPLRKLVTSLDDIATECEAQASDGNQLDASDVAWEIRQCQASLSHILGELNIAEEQRANDVFKAVDWLNNSRATTEKRVTAAHIAEMNDVHRRTKDDLAKRENEYWQMRFSHEGEIWRLKRQVERLSEEITALRRERDGELMVDDDVSIVEEINGSS